MTHTALIKWEGDRRARRVPFWQVQSTIAAAQCRTCIRRTVHQNGTETTVTYFYFANGKRLRVTETTAI
jgi:hypothetical protein